MQENNMYAVKKAYFPYNLILWIFKKKCANQKARWL